VVTASFFAELADVLDCLSTSVDPVEFQVTLTFDWIEREIQTLLRLAILWLIQLVNGITHEDDGGTLNIVCVRDDNPLLMLICLILGSLIIDCFRAYWKSCLPRLSLTYVTSLRRSWRPYNREIYQFAGIHAVQSTALESAATAADSTSVPAVGRLQIADRLTGA